MKQPKRSLSAPDTLKATILIVDDQPTNLHLLRSILSMHHVRLTTTGSSALTFAQTALPDLILLDVKMPEMNGFEVCRRLKSDPQTKFIPVIFISALNDSADKLNGFHAGGVDYITKPFQVEEVLARVQTHLSLRTFQKTLEEKNRLLSEALQFREHAEQITRHDLKSPLTPIISYPRMIRKNPHLTDKDLGKLKLIERAGLRILDSLSRSLDLFKIEDGSYSLKPADIDLFSLIVKIAEECYETLDKKNLSLTIRVNGEIETSEPFTVQGEELLCRSLLNNLLTNAIEASPTGEEIEIDLDHHEDDLIRIHNQGVVPAEIHERFFEKFVTHGKANGTGLGTHIAKLITELHGGTLHMKSTPEEGTTLLIHLPVFKQPEQIDPAIP